MLEHDDWKLQMLATLKSRDSNCVPAARAIVMQHMPARLFRYRAINEYKLDELRTGSVRLTPAGDFNDPFDCGLMVDTKPFATMAMKVRVLEGALPNLTGADRAELIAVDSDLETFTREALRRGEPTRTAHWREEQVRRVVASQAKTGQAVTDKLVRDLKRFTRIACFSETATQILMWSHYASNHKGMCLAYSTADIVPYLLEQVFPVVYDSDRFDLTPWGKPLAGEPIGLIPIVGALHKATDWTYEREWRLILSKNVEVPPPGLFVPLGRPAAVYLGALTSPEDEKLVREAAGDLPVIRMHMSQQRYAIEPVEAANVGPAQ